MGSIHNIHRFPMLMNWRFFVHAFVILCTLCPTRVNTTSKYPFVEEFEEDIAPTDTSKLATTITVTDKTLSQKQPLSTNLLQIRKPLPSGEEDAVLSDNGLADQQSSLPTAATFAMQTTPLILTDSRRDAIEHHHYFKSCSLECKNGGFCRKSDQGSEETCICTPDFSDKICDQPYKPLLKDCSEATCQNKGKCLNGEEGTPVCFCGHNTSGRYCERRLREFIIEYALSQNDQPLNWSEALRDPSTEEFASLANETIEIVTLSALLGDNETIASAFKTCIVLSFFPGSTWAKVKIILDMNDTVASNISESDLKQHLETGISRMRKILIPIGVDLNIVEEASEIYPLSVEDDALIIFVCFIVGIIIGSTIILVCGCRRTIWDRYRNRHSPDSVTLVNMPSNYYI